MCHKKRYAVNSLRVKRVDRRHCDVSELADLDINKNNIACAAAERLQSASSHPAVVLPMKASHVSGGYWLQMPKHFHLRYMPQGPVASKHAILVGLMGRPEVPPWEVNYNCRPGDTAGLSGGWRGVAIDLELRCGDAVLLEKTLNTDWLYDISVVRAGKTEVDYIDTHNVRSYVHKLKQAQRLKSSLRQKATGAAEDEVTPVCTPQATDQRVNEELADELPTTILEETSKKRYCSSVQEMEPPLVAEAHLRPVVAPLNLSTERGDGRTMHKAALSMAMNRNFATSTEAAQPASTSYAPSCSFTPKKNNKYGAQGRTAPSCTPPATQPQAHVAATTHRPRTASAPKKGLRCCECDDAIDIWLLEGFKSDNASELMCADCREAKAVQRDDSGAEQPQSLSPTLSRQTPILDWSTRGDTQAQLPQRKKLRKLTSVDGDVPPVSTTQSISQGMAEELEDDLPAMAMDTVSQERHGSSLAPEMRASAETPSVVERRAAKRKLRFVIDVDDEEPPSSAVHVSSTTMTASHLPYSCNGLLPSDEVMAAFHSVLGQEDACHQEVTAAEAIGTPQPASMSEPNSSPEEHMKAFHQTALVVTNESQSVHDPPEEPAPMGTEEGLHEENLARSNNLGAILEKMGIRSEGIRLQMRASGLESWQQGGIIRYHALDTTHEVHFEDDMILRLQLGTLKDSELQVAL